MSARETDAPKQSICLGITENAIWDTLLWLKTGTSERIGVKGELLKTKGTPHKPS
jgi:hypothetical protein